MAKVLEERPWIWSSHVWNMFDFGCAARSEGGVAGRNNKGLVTMDRKTKKDSYYIYRAYWNKEPMVHICGRRYAQRAGETTDIRVYSNQPVVKLYLNGRLVEEKAAEKEPSIYVLPEVNARAKGAANWFKLTVDLDLKAPMEFPEGKYSVNDRMEEIAKSPEAFGIVTQAMETVMNRKIKQGEGAWDMIRSMSLKMVCDMVGAQAVDGFLESLNGKVTRIDKV